MKAFFASDLASDALLTGHAYVQYERTLLDVESAHNIRPGDAPPLPGAYFEMQCAHTCVTLVKMGASAASSRCKVSIDPESDMHHYHQNRVSVSGAGAESWKCCLCGYTVNILGAAKLDVDWRRISDLLKKLSKSYAANPDLRINETMTLISGILQNALKQSWERDVSKRKKTNINLANKKFHDAVGSFPDAMEIFSILGYKEITETTGKALAAPEMATHSGVADPVYCRLMRTVGLLDCLLEGRRDPFMMETEGKTNLTKAIEATRKQMRTIVGGQKYPRTTTKVVATRSEPTASLIYRYLRLPEDASDDFIVWGTAIQCEHEPDIASSLITFGKELGVLRKSEKLRSDMEELEKKYVTPVPTVQSTLSKYADLFKGLTAGQSTLNQSDDAQLDEAIRLSQMDGITTSFTSPDSPAFAATPTDYWEKHTLKIYGREKRVNSQLAGLLNSENICYLNSVLQAYFYLKPFRTAILGARVVEDTETRGGPLQASHEFLLELQALFSGLMSGTAKAYSPSRLMQTLLALSPDPRYRLMQHNDVSEYMTKFLDCVQTALKSGAGMTDDVVDQLFFGNLGEEYGHSEGGVAEVARRAEKFSHVILPLSDSLESSLWEFSTREELPDEGGHVQRTKQTTFDALPPVLTFQLARSQYDRETHAAVKDKRLFTFQDRLYMDPYMSPNRAAFTPVLDRISTMKAELAALTSQGATGLSQEQILGHAIDIMSDMAAAVPNADAAIATLRAKLQALTGRMAELTTGLERAQAELAAMTQQEALMQHCYRLHAILIHSGSTTVGGHYYAFIRDWRGERWLKFNDTDVHEVPSNEVERDSSGMGTTGAYCLIYTLGRDGDNTFPGTTDFDLVPQGLKEAIAKCNR